MKRTSVFPLITLLSALTACQAPTSSPNQNQPSAYPSAGMIPYSYDAIDSRTEADVTARRESRQIAQASVSPDGSQVIYQERLEREVDLRDFSRNPARLTVEAGLWYQDAQGNRRALDLGTSASAIVWLDNHSIAWLDNSFKDIQRLDLKTGERSSLYKGVYLSSLSAFQGKLYLIESSTNQLGNQLELVRLTPGGSAERFKLPHADFYTYYSPYIKVLSPDIVMLTRAKSSTQSGQYPFKVMTTPPPPVFDTFVFSLEGAQAEPLKGGLDLSSNQNVSVAPDQAHYAIQASADGSTNVYTRAGQQLFVTGGKSFWLDSRRLLVLDTQNLELSVRSLPGDETIYRAATQGTCTNAIASGSGAIVQCDARVSDKKRTRLYSLTGTIPPGGPLQELKLDLPANGQATITEDGLLLAHLPGPEGHAALYTLDAQGEPQRRVLLENPDQASFSFNPRDYWFGTY